MYEMSPYSTPILWSAWVAGPVKGEVVASWRNTSRNDFSNGVRICISRPPLFGLFVCVCLPNFLQRPVGRIGANLLPRPVLEGERYNDHIPPVPVAFPYF